MLDEQLGDWTERELSDFVSEPGPLQRLSQRLLTHTAVSGGTLSSTGPLAINSSPGGIGTGVAPQLSTTVSSPRRRVSASASSSTVTSSPAPAACSRRAASALR